MKIVIRYCGGCNPEYRRERVEELIKRNFPHLEFAYSGTPDFYVLINGCRRRCLLQSFGEYKFVYFDSEMDDEETLKRFKNGLSQMTRD